MDNAILAPVYGHDARLLLSLRGLVLEPADEKIFRSWARKKFSNPKPAPNSNPNPSLALTPNLTLTLPGTQEVLARPVPADRQLGGLVEPLLIPILSLTQTRTPTPTN